MNIRSWIGAICVFVSAVGHAQGYLENPAQNSIESGVGLISGFHCSASTVEIRIDGRSIGNASVGSGRADAASLCGRTETGYGLLVNFNSLTPGAHTVQAYANGVKFAESSFNSVKSGGTEFLVGASKQVSVPDFPTAGQTATLTWSQAKQGFVVSAVSAKAGTAAVGGGAYDELLGLVTLKYKFNGSANIYTDSARFSASSISSDGETMVAPVIGSASRAMGCTPFNSANYEYFCIVMDSYGMDAFLINVSSTGGISGTYEFCSSSVSAYDCAADLAVTPDGTVTGTVTQTTGSLSLASATAGNAQLNGESKLNEKPQPLRLRAGQLAEDSITAETVARIIEAIEKLR